MLGMVSAAFTIPSALNNKIEKIMNHFYQISRTCLAILLLNCSVFMTSSFAATNPTESHVNYSTKGGIKPIVGKKFVGSQPNVMTQGIRVSEETLPSHGSGEQIPASLPMKSQGAAYQTMGTSFTTIDFDTNAARGGFYNIPPDPCSATGQDHVVLVVNTSIEWYTKSGSQLASMSLKSFFGALTNTFDPKVIYDQYEDRFVVVTLEKTYSPDTSFMYVAVSQTGDPTQGWYGARFDVKQNFTGTDGWFDYPGFAVDNQAVYITGNYFPFSGSGLLGTRLIAIDKGTSGGFYAGSSATTYMHDPVTATGALDVTLQPAHMFGSQTGVSTFIIGYSGINDGTNEYLQLIQILNPLSGSPTYNLQYVFLGDITNTSVSLPDAPQLGSAQTIEVNDRRTLNAVWRDSVLWVAACDLPSSGTDAGQATARWFKISTQNLATLSLDTQGEVGAEDLGVGTYTFFPSIAVNEWSDAVIGFSASNSSIYAGAYYAYMPADSSSFGSTMTVKVGEAPYYRAFSGSRNRWGDYTSVAIDPVDNSFWVFNEYAKTTATGDLGHTGETGAWGTAILSVDPIVPDPSSLAATNQTTSTIDLNWNGNSPEFRVLQKQGSSSGSPVDGAIVYEGSNLNTQVTSLSENTAYYYTVYGKSGTFFSSSSQKIATATTSSSQSDSTVIAFLSGQTGSQTFGSTGITINLTTGSGTDGSINVVVGANPGSALLPPTIENISQDKFWTITNDGLSGMIYNITLDLTGISGISDFSTLSILKRDGDGQPWADLKNDGFAHSYANPNITVTGLTGFSDFAVGGGSDNPLPVEIAEFTVKATSLGAKLNWVTQTETDNLGFIVSRNGNQLASYKQNEALKGQGTSINAHHYSFTDQSVVEGETYEYALISVDYSGLEHRHPKVVEINFGDNDEGIIENYELAQNYPNPFNPSTTINFTMKKAGFARLKVFDILGRVVYNEAINATKGNNTVKFNAKNLTSGVYFYQLNTEGFSKTMKMMLMK